MRKSIDNIQPWRVDNIYPIVISFVTMILTVSALYWGLSNKIDLLTQKVDYYIEKTNTNINSIRELQTYHNNLSIIVGKCCPTF